MKIKQNLFILSAISFLLSMFSKYLQLHYDNILFLGICVLFFLLAIVSYLAVSKKIPTSHNIVSGNSKEDEDDIK